MTSWLRDTPIAHRGLHGEGVPENSIPAVEQAIEAGYAVEVDVRLTSDGVAVVFHDTTLERMTGETASVEEHSFDRLSQLYLQGTSSAIPSLQELLDVVGGRTPVLVEVKNFGKPGRLEERVRKALADYAGPFAVQSFNPRSVRWFREHAPAFPRGQVAGALRDVPVAGYKRFLLRRLALNVWTRPDFVAYEIDALPYWPVTVHRALGVPVVGWTARSRAEHEAAREHVDNVIFEGYRP